jgi:hypothetical protein
MQLPSGAFVLKSGFVKSRLPLIGLGAFTKGIDLMGKGLQKERIDL